MKTLSFDAGDLKKPEFLKLNPRHRVPVIVDDGFALYPMAALTLRIPAAVQIQRLRNAEKVRLAGRGAISHEVLLDG